MYGVVQYGECLRRLTGTTVFQFRKNSEVYK